jgi:hypothetical protein
MYCTPQIKKGRNQSNLVPYNNEAITKRAEIKIRRKKWAQSSICEQRWTRTMTALAAPAAVPGSSHHLNHQPSLRRSAIRQAMTEPMRISSFSCTVLVRTALFLSMNEAETNPPISHAADAITYIPVPCRAVTYYTTAGDTHVPFSKLSRSFKLPQTATLALRAPEQYVNHTIKLSFFDIDTFQHVPSLPPKTQNIYFKKNDRHCGPKGYHICTSTRSSGTLPSTRSAIS